MFVFVRDHFQKKSCEHTELVLLRCFFGFSLNHEGVDYLNHKLREHAC
jgi:hypothetical protein